MIFLLSRHLPAAMVAAFAKRLARISLRAPASSLTITVPFIYNLINRHPNCKVLIHRETPVGMKCQLLQKTKSTVILYSKMQLI